MVLFRVLSMKNLLVLALLGPVIAQKICTLTDEESTFDNQDDITSRLANCTTIDGNIFISPKFEGTLSIPGIDTILGDLELGGYPLTSDQPRYGEMVSGLKSVVLSNLSSLYVMDTKKVPSLETVNMQKLQRAWKLQFNSSRLSEINLPSLETIDTIKFLGNFKSIELPNLKTVNVTLVVDNYHQPGESLISVSFPHLTSAFAIDMSGNLSKVSFPQLEKSEGKFRIESTSTASVNIDAPRLTNVTNMDIEGKFEGNLTLPSLLELNGVSGIKIKSISGGRVYVEFPKLVHAYNIDMDGEISGVSLPSFQSINGPFDIQSNVTMQGCDSLHDIWERAQKDVAALFTCNGATTNQSRSRKLRLGLGVGLGLGIPFFGACAFLLWFFTFREKKEEYEMPNSGCILVATDDE